MRAKTKIIATLGPASSSPEMIAKLMDAGARIFRLNFSHGDASSFIEIVKTIRELEQKNNFPVTIMQDLAGPKIRLGTIEEGSISFAKGDTAYLGPKRPDGADMPYLPFDHPAILKNMTVGDRMVLADGSLQFRVAEQRSDALFVLKAGNAGIVTSRKGLALPDKSVPVPALTDKDKKDLRDGLRLGVDAVALSFVQSARDILDAKAIIHAEGRDVPVVAKLERQNAVQNLEEILAATDIVMVARGDLGIECPLQLLPGLQKKIIKACNKAAKPVIVATQMLLSMVNNPTPTRAETTDVANAVLDGADCVMLSEETAMGNHPVDAVAFMGEIAAGAEALTNGEGIRKEEFAPGEGATSFITYAACRLAEELDADALVAYSVSGTSARTLASRRPGRPVYAISPYSATLHTLNFSWGLIPVAIEADSGGHLEAVENFVEKSPLFQNGATVILTAGQARSGETASRGSVVGANLMKVFSK
ncbi:MAG: pyruvate kinase [Deltaproteobacteria bacterium]|jgi:pyruvate kinase|nr:pyruvate kinase [Deltaproteobacteria bacterium]